MTGRPVWTQLDYARAVACEFAAALKQADPASYEVLVSAARGIGQGWIVPAPDAVTPGERITTREASELLQGVPESTIRYWVNDPTVPVWRQYGGLDPRELLAWQASKRQQDKDRAALAAELGEKYKAGATIRDLQDETGRSADYVVTLLREAGVVLRRRGHR